MPAKEVAKEIGEDIIDDDQHGGDYEVDQPFEDIEAHEPGSWGAYQCGNNNPAEQSELILEKPLFEGDDEAEEPYDEQSKGDEVMMKEQGSDKRVLYS